LKALAASKPLAAKPQAAKKFAACGFASPSAQKVG